MDILNIVKIGGKVVDDEGGLKRFLKDFAGGTSPKILVHGGGKLVSDLCVKLEIPVRMTDGRRITDEASLDVAVMVYAGLVNKKIVAHLQGMSVNALGLSGADLDIIPATKRNHPEIDYGMVGDIKSNDINRYFIRRLLEEDIVPVFSAITHDNSGQLLNTNADTVASVMASALARDFRVHLTYCFEKPGVLSDAGDEDSWLESLSASEFEKLKREGTISEGMIPKLDNAFDALNGGASRVVLKHFNNLLNETGTELLS